MGIFVVMLIVLDESPFDYFRHFRGSLFFASTSVLRATNSFHTRPYNRQILRRKPDASHKERNSLTFFNFLYMVRTVSLWNHHQTTVSYPVKNSSTFKISPICCHQPTKNRFVTTATSVESWIWKIRRIFSQIFHVLHQLNAAGHSCFSLRGSNPREHFDFRSRFLCFQTANQKIRN